MFDSYWFNSIFTKRCFSLASKFLKESFNVAHTTENYKWHDENYSFNTYIKGENLIINEKTKLPGMDQPPLLYKYKINLKTFQVSAYNILAQKTYQSYSKCKKVEPFPFNLNPKDFSKYLSSAVTEENLSDTNFNDLNDCKLIKEKYKRQYVCHDGFITISEGLGETVCGLSYVKYYKASGKFEFQIKNDCR